MIFIAMVIINSGHYPDENGRPLPHPYSLLSLHSLFYSSEGGTMLLAPLSFMVNVDRLQPCIRLKVSVHTE